MLEDAVISHTYVGYGFSHPQRAWLYQRQGDSMLEDCHSRAMTNTMATSISITDAMQDRFVGRISLRAVRGRLCACTTLDGHSIMPWPALPAVSKGVGGVVVHDKRL